MLVKPEGPKDFIALIGEAPGAEEEQVGKPFVGPAGRMLNSLLAQAGLDRSKLYLTNIMQTRPPNNKFEYFFVNPKTKEPRRELIEGIAGLKAELISGSFKAIVPMGAWPLWALLGLEGIKNWRGSILSWQGIPVIPMNHPAAALHTGWGKSPEKKGAQNLIPLMVFYLQKAKKEALSPKPLPKEPLVMVPYGTADAHAFYSTLKKQKRLAFDIETVKGVTLGCVGFALSSQTAVVFPFVNKDGSIPFGKAVSTIAKWVGDLLADPQIERVAHNAVFDINWLSSYGFRVNNLHMDTMLAQHVLTPELPKALAFCQSVLSRRPYYDYLSRGSTSQWHTYNALDCCVCFEVAAVQEVLLRQQNLWGFYLRHVHPMIYPVLEMMRRGVRMNTTLRAKVSKQIERQVKYVNELLEKAAGHPVNVNTSDSLKEFLYGEMHYPVIKSTPKRGPSTDNGTLENLYKKRPTNALRLIQTSRKWRHSLSNDIGAPVDRDGRMRCSYNIPGTETGRLSSSKSLRASGTNLQNVERGLPRSLYIPSEGHIFIVPDLSQADARCVAFLAQDLEMIKAFEEGLDIHSLGACILFPGAAYKTVTALQRRVAKSGIHAMNYKVGPRTLANHIELNAHVDCNQSQAQAYIRRYYLERPGIPLWHKEVAAELYKSRVLVTPLGRRRYFYGRSGESLVKEAIAFVPQSTVADITNQGMVRAWAVGIQLVLNTHDGLVAESTPENVQNTVAALKKCMEMPIKIHNRTMLIPCEFKIGANWEDLIPFEGTGLADWKRLASYVPENMAST